MNPTAILYGHFYTGLRTGAIFTCSFSHQKREGLSPFFTPLIIETYSDLIHIHTGCVSNPRDSPTSFVGARIASLRSPNWRTSARKSCSSSPHKAFALRGPHLPPACFLYGLSSPILSAKIRMPQRASGFLVREMGLEPTRRNHTHLKRACLPFQHSRKC